MKKFNFEKKTRRGLTIVCCMILSALATVIVMKAIEMPKFQGFDQHEIAIIKQIFADKNNLSKSQKEYLNYIRELVELSSPQKIANLNGALVVTRNPLDDEEILGEIYIAVDSRFIEIVDSEGEPIKTEKNEKGLVKNLYLRVSKYQLESARYIAPIGPRRVLFVSNFLVSNKMFVLALVEINNREVVIPVPVSETEFERLKDGEFSLLGEEFSTIFD